MHLRLAVLFLLIGGADDLRAQSTVTIELAADRLASGENDGCRYKTAYRKFTSTGKDSLTLSVFSDSTFGAVGTLPADIKVQIASEQHYEVKKGKSSEVFELSRGALAERVISIWRLRSTEPLCVFEPFPYRAPGPQGNPFTTHTDIMASGEISNALRTGTTDAEATGSLGFHHRSFAKPGKRAAYFPYFGLAGEGKVWKFLKKWTAYRVDGEDLRATIGVAGTVQPLSGTDPKTYAEALLAPSSATQGNLGSVDLQYRPFREYGSHQSVGVLARFVGTRSQWQRDTTQVKSTLVLLGWDTRVHWVVINQRKENDANSLEVAFDAGYIYRAIGGDAATNRAIIRNTLGVDRRAFHGTAIGTYLTLRQVTAFADFMCLSCKPFRTKHPKIEGLEGLQPRIGFRFEAPFVTIR
jgi:hypothetical protein